MALPPAYRAFAAMVAHAQARPELWRLGAGLALSAALYAAFVSSLMAVVWLSSGPKGLHDTLEGMTGGGGPAQTALLLFSFLGMALATWGAARALHGRSLRSLIGADLRRAGRDFLRCFLGYGALALVAALPFMLVMDVVPNLAPRTWLLWLGPALALLFLQVGAEELLFRGWLQSQLAARFTRPALWLGLPAIVFGLAHYAPAQSGPNAWAVVAAVTLFGLIAGDLTARSGSIGAATGFHLANNTLAILVLSTQGSIDGLSLWRTGFAADDPSLAPLMLIDAAVLVAGWALCRRLIARPVAQDTGAA